jgi:hypothetical protein
MKDMIKARCTTQKNQLQYSKDKLREFTKKLSLLFCVKNTRIPIMKILNEHFKLYQLLKHIQI